MSSSKGSTFFNPVALHWGEGCLASLNTNSQDNILLICSEGFKGRPGFLKIKAAISPANFDIFTDVQVNPDLKRLDVSAVNLRDKRYSKIIAVGGGSVLDTAKVLSVLIGEGSRSLKDIFERDGGKQNWKSSIPVVAIPTTAGTGAEVTPFATVWDHENKKKYSIQGDKVFPERAFLLPELTLTLNHDQTLFPALDTLSHCLESLWNKNATSLSEGFAKQGWEIVVRYLPFCLKEPQNIEAREKLQLASAFAGIAISQTRTAIAHSISYPVTMHFGVPHGLACSFTLSSILSRHQGELTAAGLPGDLISQTISLLNDLKLHKYLGQYLTKSDLHRIEGEMLTPGRSDNFLFKVDRLSDFFGDDLK